MAYALIEESRTESVTWAGLVAEDYDQNPRLCRSGVWWGLQRQLVETVVLSFEHTPDELMVGWAIDGVTLVDPGFSAGTLPWGEPVPSAPGLIYVTPFGGHFHKLQLRSTAGMTVRCPWVEALYRRPNRPGDPPTHGADAGVCLTGSRLEWPKDKLEAEASCIARWKEILRRYAPMVRVGPMDPVTEWLEVAEPSVALRLGRAVFALGELDHAKEPEIVAAVAAEVAGTLDALKRRAQRRLHRPGAA